MFHVAVTRTVEKKRQRQCFNIVPRELCFFCITHCKDIKIFLQLTRWSIIGWEKGVKIVEKKSRNYLEVAWKSPYLCTRFERETPLESDKNRFWKILKKVLKSFGDSEKRLTFAPASMRSDKQKGSENFLKNLRFSLIFVCKIILYII